MRKALWVIAVALAAALSPVLKADTTYTVNQTFNVDTGDFPVGNPNYTATTSSITGFITTDGKTGVLSSSDITGFDLTNVYGSTSGEIVNGEDGGNAEILGSALYATPLGLFFTALPGGGTLSVVKGNGHAIIESLSSPVCLDLTCLVSDPPALTFLSEPWAPVLVTGSVPFTAAIMPIATATPEPSTAILCFLGLTLIFLFRKRLGMACIRPVWPDKSGSAI